MVACCGLIDRSPDRSHRHEAGSNTQGHGGRRDTVFEMPGKGPTAEDRGVAIVVALSGSAKGRTLAELASELARLHPRNNTFPGEVLLELAADALEEGGVSAKTPSTTRTSERPTSRNASFMAGPITTEPLRP